MKIENIERQISALKKVCGRPVGTLDQISGLTDISRMTLYSWARRGWIENVGGSLFYADSVVSAAKEAMAAGKWPRSRKPR